MQHTLATSATLSGTGLHSGTAVRLTLRPATVDTGIVFVRTDVRDRDPLVPALWDRVVNTRLCTEIANADGVAVSTIEHLMAALCGCGVDNACIEIDGPETPIMDGSAAPFVELIDRAGLKAQAGPRRVIKIIKPVTVTQDGKTARLLPAVVSSFSGAISFDHPVIGEQTCDIALLNGNFRHSLADARTFGFLHEIEALRAMGLARGGSVDNAIVLDSDKILNEEGLRHDDEFIRHKLLDAVGDLYLAGGMILGAYEADRPGHALNNALLHALFAQPDAWVEEGGDDRAHLPAERAGPVAAMVSAL